jgi:hypothetical protein
MVFDGRGHERQLMRIALITLALVCALSPAAAQTDGKPTDEKALKTYTSALQLMRDHMQAAALGEFKKADKQDGGHCYACQQQMLRLGSELDDWKTVELAAPEIIADAKVRHVVEISWAISKSKPVE